MEIPLQASVECTDGVCGQSTYVLMNPVSEQVTHLVVKQSAAPHTERIVPVETISATVASSIQLRCRRGELEQLEPFVKTGFIAEQIPDISAFGAHGIGAMYFWPYVEPAMKTVYQLEPDLQIPTGEIAVRRGTRVEASDGYVGHVDEFVVNPDNDHITHLVLREGHLWGKKDVIIPVSAIGKQGPETLFLTMNKHQIEKLPTFPLQRHWA